MKDVALEFPLATVIKKGFQFIQLRTDRISLECCCLCYRIPFWNLWLLRDLSSIVMGSPAYLTWDDALLPLGLSVFKILGRFGIKYGNNEVNQTHSINTHKFRIMCVQLVFNVLVMLKRMWHISEWQFK